MSWALLNTNIYSLSPWYIGGEGEGSSISLYDQFTTQSSYTVNPRQCTIHADCSTRESDPLQSVPFNYAHSFNILG